MTVATTRDWITKYSGVSPVDSVWWNLGATTCQETVATLGLHVCFTLTWLKLPISIPITFSPKIFKWFVRVSWHYLSLFNIYFLLLLLPLIQQFWETLTLPRLHVDVKHPKEPVKQRWNLKGERQRMATKNMRENRRMRKRKKIQSYDAKVPSPGPRT